MLRTLPQIRPATLQDAHAIAQLWGGDALHARVELHLIQRDHIPRTILVAVCQSTVVGAGRCGWRRWPGTDLPDGWYLLGVAVHPHWRRQHIGLALIQARMQWTRAHTDTLWSTVAINNQPAINLHKRAGFTCFSQRDSRSLMRVTLR